MFLVFPWVYLVVGSCWVKNIILTDFVTKTIDTEKVWMLVAFKILSSYYPVLYSQRHLVGCLFRLVKGDSQSFGHLPGPSKGCQMVLRGVNEPSLRVYLVSLGRCWCVVPSWWFRNPAINHLGCINIGKWRDKLPNSTSAGFIPSTASK